ncbi:hypothetical protein [Rhizobium bangladeshense]|uniref:hypothetical protein n=1 Tax=Rhizobium bangladeshense TaxID=1138189 RepID=UPI001C82D1FE|nr:hypothetical protein [Rhizobium bangladeshense]MBX4894908.1 hypothetical protein [Rhizobium bangladeshense]
MKITLISEDFPDNKIVDWPAVPGTGDRVSFHFRGGTTNQAVKRVDYHADADGSLTEVTVELTY